MIEQENISRLSETDKNMLILELRQKLEVIEKERSQLEQRLAIHQHWSRLHGKLFPSDCRCRIINGIDLDLLAADFYGCITTFTIRGKLNPHQKQYLVTTGEKLQTIINDLEGYASYYFKRLGFIGSLIIEFEQRCS